MSISYRTKHKACIVHKKGILVYWSLVLLFFSPSLFSVVLVVLFICCLVGIIWNETSVRLRLFYTESCSVESKTVIVQVDNAHFLNFSFRLLCSAPPVSSCLSLSPFSPSLDVNLSHSFSPWLYLSKYLSLLLTFFLSLSVCRCCV